MTQQSRSAAIVGVAALLVAVGLGALLPASRAGGSPSQTCNTLLSTICQEDSTTTEVDDTTTTEADDTTTTARATTTSARATPTSAATTASTTETDDTTPSTVSPLVVPGPTDAVGNFVTTTLLPVSEVTATDSDNAAEVVAAVITGLLVVAVLLTVLTVWYWRRTRPARVDEPD